MDGQNICVHGSLVQALKVITSHVLTAMPRSKWTFFKKMESTCAI